MQVKKILSKPQFKEYEFITKFIDVIDFNKLDPLNKMTHDSSQTKRNFSNIKKFLQIIVIYNMNNQLLNIYQF
jgi:CRISPR/Cas system CSM-associated protein Csm2 small subunit